MRPQTLLRLSDLLARFERPLRGAARAVLEPRKPRHRALRAVLALTGVVLLGVFAVAAIAIGTLVIVGGLGWRLLRRAPLATPVRGDVLEGTYRVVSRPLLTR